MNRDKTPCPADSFSLRLATAIDLPILARIHKQAYSLKHFTSLLSEDTLACYYGYFINEGSEILLAQRKLSASVTQVRDDAEVVGFAVYGHGIPARIAMFKREAAKDILLASIRHPLIAFRKFCLAICAKVCRENTHKPADFLLLSIAACEVRHGIGSYLLQSMVTKAAKTGSKVVGLYVNANNLNAINAYFAAGFDLRHYLNGQFYMEKNLVQR